MVDRIVTDMIADHLAEKRFYHDERVGRPYWNLSTPGAFSKKFTTVAVLGHPERVGVWSYTLLSQARVAESSMEPYFRAFAQHDLGLVAIDPHVFGPDLKGDSFIYQIERVVADVPPDSRIGFLGFSMGGRILVECLEQRPELLARCAGLVLIDPVSSHPLQVARIRRLLDSDTLLIASQGDGFSPGDTAAALLKIPKTSFAGIHGQMPNKALEAILDFFGARAVRP
jgi:pimeloyl-ACP methyl ester carboxylesterase